MSENESKFCSSCFRNAEFIGEFAPGLNLIRWDNNIYSLVEGHDEIVRFHEPPPRMTEDDEQNIAALMAYGEKFREYFTFPPTHGWQFTEQCRKAGFNAMSQDWLCYWTIERVSDLIYKK